MRGTSFIALALSIAAGTSCASSGTSGGATTTVTESSPDHVTLPEIQAVSANSAYDLVRRLRPRWLQDTATGSIAGGSIRSQQLLVYLDDTRLGSVDALKTLSSSGIISMQYYDAVRAATVLRDIGSGSVGGAIVIKTR